MVGPIGNPISEKEGPGERLAPDGLSSIRRRRRRRRILKASEATTRRRRREEGGEGDFDKFGGLVCN